MTKNFDDENLIKFGKSGLSLDFVIFEKLTDSEKEIYNKVKFITTKRKEDFISIYSSIETLKNIVIQLLKNSGKQDFFKNTLADNNPILNELKRKLEGN